MTANIVSGIRRNILPREVYTDLEYSALETGESGRQQRNTAGQLWEREAERTMVTTSLQNVTDEQADRMHAVLYSAQRRARIFERGPLVCRTDESYSNRLGRHVCPSRDTNGIIRAGERIK